MFGRKKGNNKDTNTANKRLVKKILGKDPGCRIYGFPCSPDIHSRMKMLADQLDVPLYGLSEHAIQLSAGLIAAMAAIPEECALLIKHVREVHVSARTIEKIAAYDEDMAHRLQVERLRRLEIDKAVQEIVVKFVNVRGGLSPRDIAWAIDYGLRCRVAVARGTPIPTDMPPEA